MFSRRTAILLVFAAALVAVGCSSNSSSSPSPSEGRFSASAAERADVEAALRAFYGATTPEDVCSTITRAFEAGIAALGAPPNFPKTQGPLPASPDCPNAVRTAVRAKTFDLTPVTITITKVLVDRDRAGAVVNDPQGARTYFLLNVGGSWLIHAEGLEHAPPDFAELAAALKA